MINDIGAWGVFTALRTELKHYLSTQYFGKSTVLRKGVETELDRKGVLYKEPYIESTPAYLTAENGIEKAALPDWMKNFLLALADAGLGVFRSPYVHQVKALEAAAAGRDVLVATGTGSGKTECFMWPLIAKLAREAHDDPQAWRGRAVRAVIMYPMNALVSDQQSRLRRLIGDPDGRFEEIFRRTCGAAARRPQFGMYTGRTPYPGWKPEPKSDDDLAETLSRFLDPGVEPESEENTKEVEQVKEARRRFSAEYTEALRRQGRVPAKKNLECFVEALRAHAHKTAPDDAELVTRFEMMAKTPDILITNYSMLEYMMIRPRERSFWTNTRAWLEANPKERLLFIIDEAHMYRGASGGEIALLIRRVLDLLGVERSRVQFIITTASMPANDRAAVDAFAAALTALAPDASDGFLKLYGERTTLPCEGLKPLPEAVFREINLRRFDEAEAERLGEINHFAKLVGDEGCFPTLDAARRWLGKVVLKYEEFHNLIEHCRGRAVSMRELSGRLFSGRNEKEGLHAVSVLLALAPLALTDKGVLFPARMHMLFRGLRGVYACLNPECPGGTKAEGLALGRVFTNTMQSHCPDCGGAVYELESHRNCGALFVRGYVARTDEETYLWPERSTLAGGDLTRVSLHLPPDGFELTPTIKSSRCWLHVKSGRLAFDDAHAAEAGWRMVLLADESKKRDEVSALHCEERTFPSCPKCCRDLSGLGVRTFETRGSLAFFNLVNQQFELQPPVPGKDGRPDVLPNEGRKVLVFSDSRQRAARLARDVSQTADARASRLLAARVLQAYREHPKWTSLEAFYYAFAIEAKRDDVALFTGEDHESLMKVGAKQLRRMTDKGKDYVPRSTGVGSPASYQEQFLQLFCAPFNSLFDAAVCWFEPVFADDSYQDLTEEYEGLPFADERAFVEFFAVWTMLLCGDGAVLGQTEDWIRRRVRPYARDANTIDPADPFPEVFRETLGWTPRQEAQVRMLLDDLVLGAITGSSRKALRLSCLRPVFEPEHVWSICRHCTGITPFDLNGRCPHCGHAGLERMTGDDLDALKFWRQPLLDTLQPGSKIRNLNIEEHSAQLSHTDKRSDLWSTTEKYELRFQDLVGKGEQPVDVLSCTTTMEVGIDIGSLVAVSMRNMPPSRENYQQRAGRAGRRGSSLSTILTYCGEEPHDAYYFRNPQNMFSGEPRSPWLDVRNTKLVRRHLALQLLRLYGETFEKKKGKEPPSLYSIPALEFVSNGQKLHAFLARTPVPHCIEAEGNPELTDERVKAYLEAALGRLCEEADNHKDRFESLSALDVLFEAGIIPTYSFPQDVVSTYVFHQGDAKKGVAYEPQRSLDQAISDYAPGRAVVVDKHLFKMGGIFRPPAKDGKWDAPAAAYFGDGHYLRKMSGCPRCGWFGEAQSEGALCPFCGSAGLEGRNDMLRPWGFAPKDGWTADVADEEEVYSRAEMPLYSTVPMKDEEMTAPWPEGHLRAAFRTNQRIFMVNRGPGDSGFAVCRACGAAAPWTKTNPLDSIGRPYRRAGLEACQHKSVALVDLGFDFVTDMLVFEIALDAKRINVAFQGNPWLHRAPQTLAEALRLAAADLLDIDSAELVAGYRRRGVNDCVIDVFLYDSLSSGAGYAVSLQNRIPKLFEKTRAILKDCTCDTACYNCIKHYRNQHVSDRLDRTSGLELLDWAVEGRVAAEIPPAKQRELLRGIEPFLDPGIVLRDPQGSGLTTAECEGMTVEVKVIPAMAAVPHKRRGQAVISTGELRFAKEEAVLKIAEALGRR